MMIMSPMRRQLIQQITKSLNHMEETGVVEFSILDELKKLREIVQSVKNKWLDNPNTDGFYFYQAARNIELIIGRMEYRFENSQKENDNPKIAEDSLVLFPLIDSVLEITESGKIDEHGINIVLEKTRDLRNTAASTNLIERMDANNELLNKENLRAHFTELMKNLDIPEQSENMLAESESNS